MYVCMFVCVFIYIDIYICVYIYVYIYVYIIRMHYTFYKKVYGFLIKRWVWAFMWLHRLLCICACDCARRHVRAWVRPPGYIADTHVMYMYTCIDA